jgi:hypothetical protein
MLRDEVWFLINPAIDGKLCLRCAEQRLGRRLSCADFADVPVNAGQARVCPALGSADSLICAYRCISRATRPATESKL